MDAKSNDNMRLVPILVGVGVVAASAMLAKIILDQRKKVLHHDLHRTANGLEKSQRIAGQEDHLGQPQREVPSEAGRKGCFVPRHKTFQVRAGSSGKLRNNFETGSRASNATSKSNTPQPDLSSPLLPTALVFLLVNTSTSPQGLITAVSNCCHILVSLPCT